MEVIKLSTIADAFEECSDEWNQFLNIKTGEVVNIPEDPWMIDEMECRELIEEVEDSDDYLILPNQYELREYPIMQEFAYDYPNETMSEKMTAALHRTKPYRHFKDLINSLGIAESYYDFRHKVYLEKAKEWCEYHCLKYEE